MNLWKEKLNIGRVIQEIGPDKDVELHVTKNGYALSTTTHDYYPTGQGGLDLSGAKLTARGQTEKWDGDWPKWFAIGLILRIEQQAERILA